MSASAGYVEAQINYVVRGEKAVFCAADRAQSYWPQDPHIVRIRRRPADRGPALVRPQRLRAG